MDLYACARNVSSLLCLPDPSSRPPNHTGAHDIGKETGLEDSTHIVCTSDHGELLGAHGGLHQKWYNAFEETVRVPMVIAEAGASSLRRGVVTDELSSHEDLVPTLLSLAEINGDLFR